MSARTYRFSKISPSPAGHEWLRVGRVPPCAPFGVKGPVCGAHGVTRPASSLETFPHERFLTQR